MGYSYSLQVTKVCDKNYRRNQFLLSSLNLYNLWTPRTGGQIFFFVKNKIIIIISMCKTIFFRGYHIRYLKFIKLVPPLTGGIIDSSIYSFHYRFNIVTDISK